MVEGATTASQPVVKAASPPAQAVPPTTMPPTTMTTTAATTAAAATPADGSSMDEDGGGELVILVKWNKSTFPVELPPSSPLSALRSMLWDLTAVRPERQKLFGLTRSPGASVPGDDVPLSTLITKAEQKVMMMGSTEEKIAAINTAAAAALASNEVADDFDIDYTAYGSDGTLAGSSGAGKGGAVVRGLRIHDAAAVAEKLRRRVANLKVKLMHPLRPGRKCLVLDIDYTIYDCRGAAERVADLGRPGLHEFMTAAYQHYDIVMWSQTNWRYLEAKLTELYNMLLNPNYKIAFVLDRTSMFQITTSVTGVNPPPPKTHEVKALELVWRLYPVFSAANTIHLDDLSRNFALNPGSGLRVTPYKNSAVMRHTDRELWGLAEYLQLIAVREPNFETLEHRNWRRYVATHGGTKEEGGASTGGAGDSSNGGAGSSNSGAGGSSSNGAGSSSGAGSSNGASGSASP